MAEEKKESDAAGGAKPEPVRGTEPQLQLVGQYVKDLSFENPGIGMAVQRPQIEFNVDLQARRIGEQPQPPQYEVEMKLRVTATDSGKPMFLLELAYAGIFLLNNVPEDSVQPIVMIECPRLLFPFARRIIADVVRDGGLRPLMIDPIDFVALYRRKLAETSTQRVT